MTSRPRTMGSKSPTNCNKTNRFADKTQNPTKTEMQLWQDDTKFRHVCQVLSIVDWDEASPVPCP